MVVYHTDTFAEDEPKRSFLKEKYGHYDFVTLIGMGILFFIFAKSYMKAREKKKN